MVLPDLSNQFSISNYSQASVFPDCERIFRVTMQRRYVDSNTTVYDANPITITNYVLAGGIGDVRWGIDDQDWVTGVTRSANVSFTLDNSLRKFNGRTDTKSFWYDSATDYYINDSLIKLEYGYKTPSGTAYYQANPAFKGFIKADTLKYSNNNTVDVVATSLLDWLKTVNVHDVKTFTVNPAFTAMGLTDKIFGYMATNANSALSLTSIANSPRDDVIYSSIENITDNAYDFLNSVARQTGSLFGLNRKNEVFLSYYDNPYYVNTQTGFANTTAAWGNNTTTVQGLWTFGESTVTADISDNSGNGNVLSATVADATLWSLTTGKFGTGLHIQGTTSESVGNGFRSGLFIEADTSATFEVLVKMKQFYNDGRVLNTNLIQTANLGFRSTNDATTSGRQLGVYITSGDNVNDVACYPAFAARLADGVIKRAHFGEDEWLYFAFVQDATNSEAKFYVNGTLVLEGSLNSVAAATGVQYRTLKDTSRAEFDSARLTKEALSAAKIKTMANYIFGNSLLLQSATVAYNLYNYGPKQNIIGLNSYSTGIEKIFNKVIVPRNINVYETQFYMDLDTATTTNEFSIQYGLTKNVWSLSSVVNSITALKNHVNGIADFECTITNNLVTIRKHATAEEMVHSNLYFYSVNTPAGTTSSNDISITSNYLIGTRVVSSHTVYSLKFNKIYAQKDMIVQNTASVNEYGPRVYELPPQDNMNDIFSQTVSIANLILTDRATPKERLNVRTTFNAGDLDILDKVTVNWRPDIYYQNEPVRDGSDISLAAMKWAADEAGPITWSAKDFWVIGMRHNWEGNYSDFTLREV